MQSITGNWPIWLTPTLGWPGPLSSPLHASLIVLGAILVPTPRDPAWTTAPLWLRFRKMRFKERRMFPSGCLRTAFRVLGCLTEDSTLLGKSEKECKNILFQGDTIPSPQTCSSNRHQCWV